MIKITKEHLKVERDPVEDSGAEFWPNEKMLWVRLGVCVVVGGVIATGIITGVVMLINKIMETN